MDILKLSYNKLQNRIFRLFCVMSGASLSQRNIAKLLNVSPTAVGKAIKSLIKDSILKIEKIAIINFIQLNRENEYVLELKRVENLKMLYESKLIDFLKNEFTVCTIILFGSYSRGYDVWFKDSDEKNSDIDVAVIGCRKKKIDLTKFEKALKRKINVNFYKTWKIHENLKESLFNGIVLHGSVEL